MIHHLQQTCNRTRMSHFQWMVFALAQFCFRRLDTCVWLKIKKWVNGVIPQSNLTVLYNRTPTSIFKMNHMLSMLQQVICTHTACTVKLSTGTSIFERERSGKFYIIAFGKNKQMSKVWICNANLHIQDESNVINVRAFHFHIQTTCTTKPFTGTSIFHRERGGKFYIIAFGLHHIANK